MDACAREAGRMFLLVEKYAIGGKSRRCSAVDRRRGWRLQLRCQLAQTRDGELASLYINLGELVHKLGGVCARTWGS